MFRATVVTETELLKEDGIITPPSAGKKRRHYSGAMVCDGGIYYRPGVQLKLREKLRKGKIPAEGTLDLHGLNKAEAEEKLAHFLKKAYAADKRCLAIIHGKGHRSQQGIPVLKQATVALLQTMPEVLAFCSMLNNAGASYVLLRRAHR